jgi:hypothetical protein
MFIRQIREKPAQGRVPSVVIPKTVGRPDFHYRLNGIELQAVG